MMQEADKELPDLRALVVDDSRVMRSMVKQTLEAAGLAAFEFTEAASGAEALDKFDAETTDNHLLRLEYAGDGRH